MKIDMGGKLLKDISKEDLMGLAKLVGAVDTGEDWHEPEIKEMAYIFGCTVYIIYICRRKDMECINHYEFCLDYIEVSYHYHLNYLKDARNHGTMFFNIRCLSYLIGRGYYIPFYKRKPDDENTIL